ncbi:NudC domain-containing protein 1 [Psilocybe cubensis]|uniref:NudC domain-containing protein 1 n=1 Tax=Psilocybe cubensis TaxID=181762 RepID=A0ACB8GZ69_PSICU|nr:NudC domain-containing protein 1 [Psilocybe cubensis]KAH9480304.1 NudC domain-containing protein 1 [Psilocybe cubensis]
MDSFKANRSLLNPKFEGYKLEPIYQEQAVARYKLSRRPTQATASGKVPLTFQEMRSRITHNHLTVDSETGRAIYVDEEFNVCLIGIPMPGVRPSFQIVYQMATPMDTSSVPAIQREYPSSVFLSPTTVVVTDGNGILYVLPIRDNQTSEPIGIFTLPTGGAVDAPFRIHNLYRSSPVTAVLLLSSRHYDPEAKKVTSNASNSTPEFDIWAVKINIFSLRPNSEPRKLEVIWHRRGQDVPTFTTFVEQVNSFLILGGSTYPDPDAKPPAKHYEPTPDEIAPIPRAGENLDATTTTTPNDVEPNKPQKPHPYSWTQTPDAVTVAFPLPSSTPKNKIKVLFTTQTLTLHVDSFPLESSDNTPAPIPHYSAKALWDSVNTTSCFWTWDREAEHAYGLLTLHMEKKNEGTRWMQVFAAAASSLAHDEENPEVPETLDPSELWHIRESLEKYTAALKSGEDASGLGLGRGVPSLVEGEADEEADAAVGRKVWATWVDINGHTPTWTRESSLLGKKEKENWEDEPITLLSTPIPGSTTPTSIADLQLILKQDVDGAVFSLVPANSAPEFTWQHTSTYCALAFVLASKQDTRFTHHIPRRGVLAFEGGSLRDRGANVYIYRPSKSGKDKWAKQSVLQVDDGSSGALLGVGCVKTGDGDVVVVCLTEGELVLINGI